MTKKYIKPIKIIDAGFSGGTMVFGSGNKADTFVTNLYKRYGRTNLDSVVHRKGSKKVYY